MINETDSISIPAVIISDSVHSAPSFLGHGLLASVLTHALAFGGYSVFWACVALWPEASTPQWYPPQAGVYSRQRAAARTIVIEASYVTARPVDRDDQLPVRIPRQTPRQATLPTAQDTSLTHAVSNGPVSEPPVEQSMEEWLEDDVALATPARELQAELPEDSLTQARLPRRKQQHERATLTSVASAATRRSEGAESEVPPRMVFNPSPEYPVEQNAAGIGGLVKVYVRLDRGGTVLNARIHHSSGVAQLDEAALSAVRRWRFEPFEPTRPTTREVIVQTRFVPGQTR